MWDPHTITRLSDFLDMFISGSDFEPDRGVRPKSSKSPYLDTLKITEVLYLTALKLQIGEKREEKRDGFGRIEI